MRTKNKPLQYKRKREGLTDYKQRLKLIASGKPRLVVRISLKNVLVQLVDYHEDGDRIITAATSLDLQKHFGWKAGRRNTPAAYLTGLLAARKVQAKNIKHAVLDIGLRSPIKGSVVFAALKGAIDGGLEVPHSPEILPSAERINGKHIKNAQFAEVKEKIMKVK